MSTTSDNISNGSELSLHWDIEEPFWRNSTFEVRAVNISPRWCAVPPANSKQPSLKSYPILKIDRYYVKAGKKAILPLLLLVVWVLYMAFAENFALFSGTFGSNDTPRWIVSVLIVKISLLCGVAAVAGSVLSFPILTLLLGLDTYAARDLCFLVHTVSMLSAAWIILWEKEQSIEWRAVLFGSLGSVLGLVLGIGVPSNYLEEAGTIMSVTCTAAALVIPLSVFSCIRDDTVFLTVPSWPRGALIKCQLFTIHCFGYTQLVSFEANWRAGMLFSAGLFGGFLASAAGSGVELFLFAVLVLMFRVSERVAKATVIVAMAINAIFGALYRQFVMGHVDPEVYKLWLVTIPFAIVFATLGAYMGMQMHRRGVTTLVCISLTVQLALALLMVRPWTSDHTRDEVVLLADSAAVFATCSFYFTLLGMFGNHLLSFLDLAGLVDESKRPTKVKVKKEIRKESKLHSPLRIETTAPTATSEDSKSDDENEPEWFRVWLYPPKRYLTPPPRGETEAHLSPGQVSVSTSEVSEISEEFAVVEEKSVSAD